MQCDSCGNETNSNYGDKFSILCKTCASSEGGKGKLGVGTKETSSSWLGTLGILSMLAGMFFLLFSPSSSMGQNNLGMGVVNLNDMFFGSSLTIVGAIFVAAQWRPR